MNLNFISVFLVILCTFILSTPIASKGSSSSSERPHLYDNFPELQTRYQVIKLLGKGSFGEVYLCKEKETGIDYAIKLQELSHEQTDKMLQEINILRSVRSISGIAHMKESGFTDDNHFAYLVLEQGGKGLDKYYFPSTLNPIEKCKIALDIIRNIINTLSQMHELDIVHGDIKRENFVYMKTTDSEHLNVKMIDFGSSDFTDELGMAKGQGFGPDYCPPELSPFEEENDDKLYNKKKADVWAVGALFFHLLIGHDQELYDCNFQIKKTWRQRVYDITLFRDRFNVIEHACEECWVILDRTLILNPEERPVMSDVL